MSDECPHCGAPVQDWETLGQLVTDAHKWNVRIFSRLDVIEKRMATMEARYYHEDRGQPPAWLEETKAEAGDMEKQIIEAAGAMSIARRASDG